MPADKKESNKKGPDKQERLDSYVKKQKELKARNTLKEVLEKELLLHFISLNQHNINEFPMLEKQRQTIINMLCQRSSNLAGYDFVKKLVSSFPVLVNRYSMEAGAASEDSVSLLKTTIFNTEGLLLKIVQSMVYSCAIVTDNFEEIFIRLFGASSVQQFNDLLTNHELDQGFWNSVFDLFVVKRVVNSYPAIISTQEYDISRTGSHLRVSYPVKALLDEVTDPKALEKTRVQTAYEKIVQTFDGKRELKFINDYLSTSPAFPSKLASGQELKHVARLVCIDPAGKDFMDAFFRLKMKGAEVSKEDLPKEEARMHYLQEQVLGLAIGSALVLRVVTEDFNWVYKRFGAAGNGSSSSPAVHFDLKSLKSMIVHSLESMFISMLTDKIGESGRWLKMGIHETKMVLNQTAEDMAQHGLTKIRKNKIFSACQDAPDYLIFNAKTVKALHGLIQLLQIEPDLARILLEKFQNPDSHRKMYVDIDLALMKKTVGQPNVVLNSIFAALQLTKSDS